MPRKKYMLSLDQEKTDYVQAALKKSGMSLSSFAEASISEFYDNLIKMNEFYKKDVADMTVPEFLQALSVFMGRLLETPDKEKEKEIEKKLKG